MWERFVDHDDRLPANETDEQVDETSDLAAKSEKPGFSEESNALSDHCGLSDQIGLFDSYDLSDHHDLFDQHDLFDLMNHLSDQINPLAV